MVWMRFKKKKMHENGRKIVYLEFAYDALIINYIL